MADDANTNGRAGASEDGVLANLPATRPSRLSRRGRAEGTATPAKTATKPKPRAAAKPRAKAAAAKPKASATAKPKPADKPVLKAVPGAKATPPARPRPVRAATPNLRESAQTANENREPAAARADAKGQSGKDLATTVVQAAGELAQIGLTVGGQIIKRAASKLPKP